MSKFSTQKILKSAGTEFVFRKFFSESVYIDFAIRFLYELRNHHQIDELEIDSKPLKETEVTHVNNLF